MSCTAVQEQPAARNLGELCGRSRAITTSMP
jgi:hypothetical protein